MRRAAQAFQAFHLGEVPRILKEEGLAQAWRNDKAFRATLEWQLSAATPVDFGDCGLPSVAHRRSRSASNGVRVHREAGYSGGGARGRDAWHGFRYFG